ncbi:coiled-coil domain-containing protein 81-like [Amazona ochrocephala]
MEHPSPFGPSLPLQGIRIPTLGSFDVVSARIQVGNSTVPIWKPVFRVARNLGLVHNLLEGQDLRGDKELKPLSYSKVATDARVSRCQAKRCILGTTSLLSRCLGNGHNVALVLRDVGVLLMEEGVVRMRFYPTFLHGIVGKRIPRGDAAEVRAWSRPIAGLPSDGAGASSWGGPIHSQGYPGIPWPSIAEPAAARPGGVPHGPHRIPDLHRQRHRLPGV